MLLAIFKKIIIIIIISAYITISASIMPESIQIGMGALSEHVRHKVQSQMKWADPSPTKD